MSKNIKGITIEIGANTTGLSKALKEVDSKAYKIGGELRQVNKLLKFNPKDTKMLAQQQQVLGDQIGATKEKLDKLKEAEKQVQEQFKKGDITEEQYRGFQREIVETESKLKHFRQELKKSIEDSSKLGNALKKSGEIMKKAGDKIASVGSNMTKKLTVPIVAAGVGMGKMAMDVETGIKKITTLADKDILPVGKIKEEVRRISDLSGIAQEEISESVYGALSAGVDSKDVFGFVESGLELSRAGFTDMETVVDATTTVLNAYGDKADDVGKIHDIFVQTQDKGKISVDELGKSIGRVIPTASSLGVDLEQLGASYAILTAKGQNSSQATTNLNGMLAELGKTGSKTDEALREISGKSFKELTEEGKSVGDILGMIDEHAEKSGLTLKDMFGSMNAGTAAITLLSDGTKGYNDSLKDMQDATGKTTENAKIMEDGMFKIQKATTNVKNALIELGEKVAPYIEKLAEKVSEMAEKFGGLDDKTKDTIVRMAGIIAVVGPILIIVGKAIALIGTIIGGIGKLAAMFKVVGAAIGAAMGAITAPIAIAVGAIVAIIVIGVALYKNWDVIKEKAAELGAWISEKWTAIKDGIGDAWNNVKEKTAETWNNMKDKVSETANNIKDGISEKWGSVKEKTAETWENIKGKTSEAWGNIQSSINEHGGGIKGVVGAHMENMKGIWGKGLDIMDKVTGGKMSKIADGIKNGLEKIKGFFSKLKLKEIKIPKPKMPKFTVDGKFGFNPPSVPKLGIKWNKEGAIFTRPTVFNTPQGFQGVGEAGMEAVLPIEKLSGIMASTLSKMKPANSITKVRHEGVIRVEGVNDKGQFIDAVNIVTGELRREARLT